jgi:hypothetical protein
MASVIISGDTSGTATLQAQPIAGNTTLTLPTTSGTLITTASGQTLTSPTITNPTISGAVMSNMASSVLTSGTAFNPMSGTNLTFPIPSWVKKITIMVFGSNSGFAFRVGTSGGIVSTGYTSVQAGVLASNQTSRFGSSTEFQGANTIGTWILCNVTGNNWTYSGIGDGENRNTLAYGSISLAGTLTQLQIVGTFTSGVANILYE